jgi:hypothetical protein
MVQRWHDLLFAHWPLPPEHLRSLVLPPLELDLFDGAAWIGVIPFRMSHVRLRALPPLPGLSTFPELNVRTYVRHEDRPGVLFLSLDAASAMAVAVARRWFRLPYFHARMECRRDGPRGEGIAYRSARTHRGARPAELAMRYRPTGPPSAASPGSLEHFLAERYLLYATPPGAAPRTAEIHHAPWPLQPAEAEIETNTMAAAGGVGLPSGPPHLCFARRLDVVVWAPRPLARPGRGARGSRP